MPKKNRDRANSGKLETVQKQTQRELSGGSPWSSKQAVKGVLALLLLAAEWVSEV